MDENNSEEPPSLVTVKSDVAIFKKQCGSLKDAITQVWKQKRSKAKVSSTPFGIDIIKLKAMNRKTQLQLKRFRDKTYQFKLCVDQKTRQLQNLQYELGHLKESIRTCIEFDSLHEKINLITDDEYTRVTGNDASTESEHQNTLNRLYYELSQRKELHANKNAMAKSILSTNETIQKKKQYLEGLSNKLKDISEFSRPLDNEMDLGFAEADDAYNAAQLLPPALYIIYSRICAFVEVRDLRNRVSIQIVGDRDLASSVNSAVPAKVDDPDVDSSDVEEQERLGNKRKKNHRKMKHAEKEKTQAKLDSPHPLTIVMSVAPDIESKWPNSKLNLTFSWLLKAKTIMVKEQTEQCGQITTLSISGRDLLSADALLSRLSVPSSNGDGDIDRSFTDSGPSTSTWGRAYTWAQKLAGIDGLPELSEVHDVERRRANLPSLGFIEAWFSTVCQRLEARMSLNAELCGIEGGILNLTEHQKSYFPVSQDIGLSTWDRVTFEELSSWPRAQTLIALNLMLPTDAFFKCQMTFKGKDALTIGVAVPAGYPEEPSLIILQNSGDKFPTADMNALHIRELESEVNCFWRDLPSEEPMQEDEDEVSSASFDAIAGGVGAEGQRCAENVLTCQLARIASCVPVLWSRTGGNASGAGDGGVVMRPSGQAVRYRTRSRPLNFLPRLGAFTYR